MKRSLKLIALSVLTAVCFIMAITMTLGMNVAKAEDAFRIEEGFSIRTQVPDGLRVKTLVPNKIEGATYGTLMLPESMCDEIDLAFDENGELNENVLNIRTWAFNNDGASYNSVLVAAKDGDVEQSFPESFYNVPITVRGYCIDGETITYTENTVTRSISYVASVLHVNGLAEGDIFDKIIGEEKYASEITLGNVIVGEEITAKYLIGNVDASASEEATVTFSGDNAEVATVNADGTIVGVKGGKFNLTATLSGDGAETITLTKEVTVTEVIDVANTYDFGIENDANLFVNGSDISATPVKMSVGGVEVAYQAVEGGYQVSADAFTSTGVKTLAVETAYTVENVKVNCVTAVIRNLTDLQSMATYATDNKASFVLANDIDCGGYTFGAGTTWANLVFDGRGYVVSNFTLANSNGLFGSRILAGIVKNLAIKGYSAVGHYTGGICNTLGAATLENIYASGSVPAGVAQTSLLVLTTDASSTFKNILVNVEDCQRDDASAITRLSTVNADNVNSYQVTNMTNVYSIDNSTSKGVKHVAYQYVYNAQGWTTYGIVPSGVGGYKSLGAFVADKENIFKDGFDKVFALENDANGIPVIKFLGRTMSYTIGNTQTENLVLSASDFAGEVSGVTLADGTALTSEYSIDGNNNNVIVPIANFASEGNYVLKVTTSVNTYLVPVKVVALVITKASEFCGTMVGTGTVLLASDIDMEGTVVARSDTLNTFTFDGQGFAVKNLGVGAMGVFGGTLAADSTIKNVIFSNMNLSNGNYKNGIANVLRGTVKNVFMSGKYNGGARCSFISDQVQATAVIKDVLVDFDTTSVNQGQFSIIGRIKTDTTISGVARVYSIGKPVDHFCYGADGTSYSTSTKILGGYTDGAAFLADKDTIFTGEFANVFSLGTDGTSTTLLFMGRTVKTF